MVDTRRHLICECGDPAYRHHHAVMSVELPPNPEPIYPLPAFTPIGNNYPGHSSYDTDQCPCGCTQYIPLKEA